MSSGRAGCKQATVCWMQASYYTLAATCWLVVVGWRRARRTVARADARAHVEVAQVAALPHLIRVRLRLRARLRVRLRVRVQVRVSVRVRVGVRVRVSMPHRGEEPVIAQELQPLDHLR